MLENAVMLETDEQATQNSRRIEQRLARALRDVADRSMPTADTLPADISSRELLQLAWERAEQEADALQTELRLMRQRHQQAERDLVVRINQRKRLKQNILERAGEPTTST